MSRKVARATTPWSIGAIVVVLAVSFWTATAQGQKYMQPGGLRGEHAEKHIACNRCHKPFLGVPDVKCLSCHKKVEREQETRQGNHAGMIGSCYRCHITHQATSGYTGVDEAGVDHNLVGFDLDEHEALRCADCHGQGFKLKHKKIEPVCVSCHSWPKQIMGNDDPEALELREKTAEFGVHKAKAGADCLKCHVGGEKVAFKHTFVFRGAHARLDCDDCHHGGPYGGLTGECVSCHKSPHKADIGGDCLKCHNQIKWSQTTVKHDLSRDCVECHQAPSGHFAGACRDCHKTTNSWESSFEHPGMEEHSSRSYPCNYCHPTGDKSVDCRRCHRSRYPKDED